MIVGHHVHRKERIHDRNTEGFHELMQRTESVTRTDTRTHQHQGPLRITENPFQFSPDRAINRERWFV